MFSGSHSSPSVWDDIQNETELLKHIPNSKELRVWDKLLIRNNEEDLMNFNNLSDNNLFGNYFGQSPTINIR